MTKKDLKDTSDINNAAANGQYIVMLTEAEKKAIEVIDAAKRRKATLLKKARDDSNTEIEEFKRERDASLKKLQTEFVNNKDISVAQFQKDLDFKINQLKSSYQQNYEKSLGKILYNLTQVNPKCHENLKI